MTDGLSDVIVHGDAFDELSALGDNSAHCAVVDYPWQFSHQNGTGEYEQPTPEERNERGKRLAAIFEMESDGRFGDLLTELERVLVDGSWLICMADDRFQDIVRDHIRESEFIFRRNWAWTPESMGMGSYGRVDHYPIPVATLGDTERYVQDRGTLFSAPGGRNVEYPTGKPVRLYRQLLEDPVIQEGETLLEPFCGSGPGAAVAAERGLGYWGCDIDADAVGRTQERFKQQRLGQQPFTGGFDD